MTERVPLTIFLSDVDTPLSIEVENGCLLWDAIRHTGLDLIQPCGGQGRCGRCKVQLLEGKMHDPSDGVLSLEERQQGFVLGCKAVINGPAQIRIPTQASIKRQLKEEKAAPTIEVPAGYDFFTSQNIRSIPLQLTQPTIDDQNDDWSRLITALKQKTNLNHIHASLTLIRQLGSILRNHAWELRVILEIDPNYPDQGRIIQFVPGLGKENDPLWACAIDIGTTTVSLWLVDLGSGIVQTQTAEYNGQIAYGEDVISRIMAANKQGSEVLQQAVINTINQLSQSACEQIGIKSTEIVVAAIVGNTTMIHLLLGIPADSIRVTPFVPGINQPLVYPARELNLNFSPEASIHCLPGVASYIGADITAGVLSNEMFTSPLLSLFIDIGTNGEIVFGNQDWLMTCACSAGPAFEGAGVKHGMRATTGAIDDVYLDRTTYEPLYSVIGGGPVLGICGSGLLNLLAECFLTGIIDKSGRFNFDHPSSRIRNTNQGGEFIVCSAEENQGKEIVFTHVDIDNFLRAKAAIYAGFSVLTEKVGFSIQDVDQVLIGGSFGKYINIEKAIQIGLLPDLPLNKFHYLGNTAVMGAYQALLFEENRQKINQIAQNMTYVELSADNHFYEAFTSALFIPNTDLNKFPTVQETLTRYQSLVFPLQVPLNQEKEAIPQTKPLNKEKRNVHHR